MNEDRGREVQGGVDKAQHVQEEKEGGGIEAEVGSWEWVTTTAGDRMTAQRMPP
jgi:hypothetical protein